ncbi:MAG: alpha-glucan family phosphorylase [Bacteroidales bacterium]|nr:alpha-glucan family phosphorylase [Bacteroidales bacterium]MDD4713118.1 alpha-glucan family phosphorylase [Bacteroidales bacterium]
MKIKVNNANQAKWSEVIVKSTMPPGLEKLDEIAHNIWWSWNYEAINLFREVDSEFETSYSGNPIVMLENTLYSHLEELVANQGFMNRLNEVYTEFRKYMEEPANTELPSVAYFSMEYGLTDILKIYSGGLGVLAGDYLKETSDCNVSMVAIGFLYRNGYFTQALSVDGQQIAIYEPQNFNMLPLKQLKNEQGKPFILTLDFPGYKVYCNVWKVSVGRVPLYLLDTDTPLNSEYDRQISAQLYGGDWENRLKQEYLLGIGGIQLLNALGIKKQVYHCNEGHAALLNVQRLADLVENQKLNFSQALEVVRASGLYTVHTPVPAGHDQFEEGLFAKYMSAFPKKLGISWDEFMDLGRENPGNKSEKFSMSVFACNSCQEVNGVSWLHGKVSQEMFNPIWKGYFPEELHVNYVTNGVHMPTWTASEWQKLYNKTFGPDWMGDQSNIKLWEKIYSVSDEEIWETRQILKQKLIEYIRAKYKENWLKGQGDPSRVVTVLERINPNALIIGFGRRFATYKRAYLLFTNLERLSKIVNNPSFPVQFVFTGKAHPADGGGQGLIKRIVEISKMPEFQGKIIFLENYDMALAKRLISGVDIWLNTPTRPLEASGTSGQKAEMNGVLNFSVLDGWWLEGYVKGAGWAITEKKTYQNDEYQDQLDAVTIYSMLENEIIPLFFAKNSKGYSPEWVMYIKNSIAKIAPRFTTKRMLEDYISKFYTKLADRSKILVEDNFRKAKEIVAWKENFVNHWDEIQVTSKSLPEKFLKGPVVGEPYLIQVTLSNVDENMNVGVELVLNFLKSDGSKVLKTVELEMVKSENGVQTYELNYKLRKAGTFSFSFRMYPKNPDLPHRQDLCYVRWF